VPAVHDFAKNSSISIFLWVAAILIGVSPLKSFFISSSMKILHPSIAYRASSELYLAAIWNIVSYL
jgi:hypothetical protein